MNFASKPTREITLNVVKNISESTPIGEVLLNFKAEDKSSPNYNYTYRIDRISDPKRQFSIDQNGALTVNNQLDREDISRYALRIEALDQAGNVGTTFVDIYLQDVNDNAPTLFTVPNPCIFLENTEPNEQPPCEIRAHDPDTSANGPPFNMVVAPESAYGRYLKTEFIKSAANNEGAIIVTPLVRFDRESDFPGKRLGIPVTVTDNGGQSATKIVYVIIGDDNDNAMSDGDKKIIVYSYLGQLKRSPIGYAYVKDKDDWDRSFKTYTVLLLNEL
uniref:Cadherin domain-containing protein n=1 Tax=Ditylenchus dipsaci TaxID=166011 RepID=A0A915E4Z8_9BILA